MFGLCFRHFHDGAADAEVELVVRYVYLEPGVAAPFVNRPTRVTAQVGFRVGGETADEIELTRVLGATLYNTVTSRMAAAGKWLGHWTGRYIEHLNAPAAKGP